MSKSKVGSYENHIKTTETSQETEAAVLEKAAFMLEDAQRAPDDDALLHASIQFNQQVWTAIQSVLNDESGLPKEVVANLMSLSIFVDRQLAKTHIEENRDLLSSVININRNIAAGLRQGSQLAARQSSQQAGQDAPDDAVPTPPPSKLPPTQA